MPRRLFKDADLNVSLEGESDKQRAASEKGCHQPVFVSLS